MQLRISLQRSHYNVENNTFWKNKTEIALSAQYSMSFPNDPKVIYVLAYIKFRIGNDMDQGHYVCDVLDYNTGTWWNCDDEIVTEYPLPLVVFELLNLVVIPNRFYWGEYRNIVRVLWFADKKEMVLWRWVTIWICHVVI